jgi:hypothetical protein
MNGRIYGTLLYRPQCGDGVCHQATFVALDTKTVDNLFGLLIGKFSA